LQLSGFDGTGRTIFAGHPSEPMTGLQYMRARWQNPLTGTFLSVDPVVANAADPQAFNAYSYARNNPVSFVDPTGEAPEVPPWWSINPCYCSGICGPPPIPTAGTPGERASPAGSTWEDGREAP
jgi:RHS repeat-associated protein